MSGHHKWSELRRKLTDADLSPGEEILEDRPAALGPRADEVLAEQLRDPAFREEWERTAFARAFSIVVLRYRIAEHVSQGQLAHRLGVSPSTVARIEAGESNPALQTIMRFHELLGEPLTITFSQKAAGEPRLDGGVRITVGE